MTYNLQRLYSTDLSFRLMFNHSIENAQFILDSYMAHGNQQLRIISGQWRGRKLRFSASHENNDLRPTSDRIKETLFNWLNPYIQNARCLDAFAGSGSLGWEALSRGAKHCHFIDTSSEVKANLLKQQTLLNAKNISSIAVTPTRRWLQQSATMQFDMVFLDPPFRFQNMAQECIDALIENQWLSKGAFIYVEQPLDASEIMHIDLKTFRQQQAGQVQYSLLIANH